MRAAGLLASALLGAALLAGCTTPGQAPDDARIVDVTPTALMLLGESVPEYMDGRALFA